ncbi:universal stress protein [Sphingomonas sp. 37zxx]|uniref:universal stress protein n=1 Tax=Sphingomonas sp. 37zxx TaxID=1550073 RepID=UPI00053BE296|nr:universal stress protein [Sphingomonas sp. 37zxx]
MSTIMVATDLSTRSDRALRRATLIARSSGAALHLVHVVDDDQPTAIVDALKHQAGIMLAAQAATVRQVDGVDCTSRVVTGEPFVRLAEAAEQVGAALLVVGPHRRQFLLDQFRGTTIERTLRRSVVPVLIANAVPSHGYGRVLVPIDFQPPSEAMVERVKSLPLGPGLQMMMLHVYDAVAEQMMSRAGAAGDQRLAYSAAERRAASVALADFARSHGLDQHVLQEVRALSGSIANDIGMAASEACADLIALSASNKGRVERAVLGSVTEAVLRDSPFDVLVMPPT